MTNVSAVDVLTPANDQRQNHSRLCARLSYLIGEDGMFVRAAVFASNCRAILLGDERSDADAAGIM